MSEEEKLAEYFEKDQKAAVQAETPPQAPTQAQKLPLCPKCGADFNPFIRPYRVPMMIEHMSHNVYFAFIACDTCRQLIQTQLVCVVPLDVQIAQPRIVS